MPGTAVKYTSRKFIVALLALGLAAGMRYLNLIGEASAVDLIKAAIWMYAASNVGQKALEALKPKTADPAP